MRIGDSDGGGKRGEEKDEGETRNMAFRVIVPLLCPQGKEFDDGYIRKDG